MSRCASAAATPVERRVRLLVVAGITLLALVAYAPVFRNDFIDLDDGDYITSIAHVNTGLSADNVRWALTTTHHGYWHPLTWLSLQLDITLFGYHAWGIHLTNLVLHIANSIALFLVLARLTQAFWPSAFLAALFAVHPMHVESVAWAAERKDVLSTFFLILTVAAYARYARQPTWGGQARMTVLFVLGLLAKPMLVTLPFALLLLDAWPLGRLRIGSPPADPLPARSITHLLGEKILLFILAIAFSILTFHLQTGTGAVFTTDSLSLGTRIANALNGYVWYLWKTLVPTRLIVFHVHRMAIPGYEAAASAALLAALTAVFVRRFRAEPALLVGWFWFLGTLFPVSGIAQSGEQAYADRFAYVPHIGLFLTLIWGIRDLARRARMQPAPLAIAAAGVLVACSALTFLQVRRWRDTETIWEYALTIAPKNYRAHASLGLYHYTHGHLPEAAFHMRESIAYQEKFPEGYYNLGRTLIDLNELPEAEDCFRRALQWNKNMDDAAHNLGNVLLRQNRWKEGADVLTRLLERKPDRADTHQLLGIALVELGQLESAKAHFDRALELQPVYAEAEHQRGIVDLLEGRYGEAEERFRKALALRTEYPIAWENLGLALARQDRWPAAAEAFASAVRQAPANAAMRGDLALALYQQGKTEDAEKRYRLLRLESPEWLAATIREALRLATPPTAPHYHRQRALELGLEAAQATQFTDASALEALATAQAAIANVEDALATLRMALELRDIPAEMRKRLQASLKRFADQSRRVNP